MDLYKLNKNKLSPIDQDQFKLEKDIQNIVEQNTEEIFNLQLVKSEFAIKIYESIVYVLIKRQTFCNN